MRRISVAFVLGIVGFISAARAQVLQVNVGSHTVQALPNQVIDVYVSGGAEILGFDLAVQVGQGDAGPIITDVDLESGIFQDNNTGQTNDGSLPRQAFYSITSNPDGGPVIADGLLLRLVLDASGVPQGSYPLILSGIEMAGFGTADSVFLSPDVDVIPAEFIDGSITVVPEPPAVLGAIALSVLAPLRRRRT